MGFFYLLIALAVLLLLSQALSLWHLWRRQTLLPYRLDDALFSPEEARLLGALDHALGSRYRIFGNVPVEDVIRIEDRVRRDLRERAAARLAERRLDFVICDAATLRVLCAVELVGTRRGLFGAKPDAVLGRVCRAAGLPLATIPAAEHYEPADLAETLLTVMKPRPLDVQPRTGPEEAPGVSKSTVDAPDGPAQEDEERLLAELGVAIRDELQVARPAPAGSQAP